MNVTPEHTGKHGVIINSENVSIPVTIISTGGDRYFMAAIDGTSLSTGNGFVKVDWDFIPEVVPVELPTKVGAVVELTTKSGNVSRFVRSIQEGPVYGPWMDVSTAGRALFGYVEGYAAHGKVKVLFEG